MPTQHERSSQLRPAAPLVSEQAVRAQLSDRVLAGRKRVLSCRDDNEIRRLEHDRLDRGQPDVCPHNGEVGGAVHEHGERVLHRCEPDVDIDLRMRPDERAHPRREAVRPDDPSGRDL